MSVPLDLSLISQLLNEQRTQGDLNNLTKPGFFFVLWPTNTPNDRKNSCHVINLVNYISNEHTAENMRIFQIYTSDTKQDKTVWCRKYSNEWSAWEQFVTATDLADYYNKTDVDALINTINTQLDTKANCEEVSQVISAQIYDTTGTAHNESPSPNYLVYVGSDHASVSPGKMKVNFTLSGDYPDNTKLAKIAFRTELFEDYEAYGFDIGKIVPAMITIKFTDSKPIVATLDTDNSDTEYFIYKVPTNLQTKTIAKGTEFSVYYLQ